MPARPCSAPGLWTSRGSSGGWTGHGVRVPILPGVCSIPAAPTLPWVTAANLRNGCSPSRLCTGTQNEVPMGLVSGNLPPECTPGHQRAFPAPLAPGPPAKPTSPATARGSHRPALFVGPPRGGKGLLTVSGSQVLGLPPPALCHWRERGVRRKEPGAGRQSRDPETGSPAGPGALTGLPTGESRHRPQTAGERTTRRAPGTAVGAEPDWLPRPLFPTQPLVVPPV